MQLSIDSCFVFWNHSYFLFQSFAFWQQKTKGFSLQLGLKHIHFQKNNYVNLYNRTHKKFSYGNQEFI
jgi:hypothetical protein